MISRSFPAVARELCKEKSLSVAIRGGSAIRADVGGVVEHRLSPSFAILAARIFRLFLFFILFVFFFSFFFVVISLTTYLFIFFGRRADHANSSMRSIGARPRRKYIRNVTGVVPDVESTRFLNTNRQVRVYESTRKVKTSFRAFESLHD